MVPEHDFKVKLLLIEIEKNLYLYKYNLPEYVRKDNNSNSIFRSFMFTLIIKIKKNIISSLE